MKRLFKSTLFLAILSGIGYLVYRGSEKIKVLKTQYETCIFFNCKSLKFDGEEIADGSYAVMFSGLEMDFTGATLVNNQATLEIFAECAGVSIRVPADWQVKLDGVAEKSGVSNTTAFNEEDVEKPVLIIKHKMKFSGLEVKY